ncbi:MAG TPA: hypothetical protein PKA28_19180 [Methylomusa anaerophila]|uniref:Uncharacterized protein n=1 Tax=Methylomusa anaerophila TaxID=1930071 RepID=A0A348AFQ0_9FIRM|nr:hypothetical protein [Methylomusa anaerophila]BBB89898.1 hypothetical protein MAMMFC1_00538 [Methylomusa anaerophila]HML90558.1 hypothetical protein [Methylomusa anaerophila]
MNDNDLAKFKGIIHSGGATGADQAFGDIGIFYGYKVIHHIFKGYEIHGAGIPMIHTKMDMDVASAPLRKASIALMRPYPPATEYEHMLLVRDHFQVKDSDFIIAIAPFAKENIVSGGTGWTVQMAVDLKRTVYVYDDCQTYKWYTSENGSGFTSFAGSIPNTGVFAGVGSRKISLRGRSEIQRLLSIDG